MRSRARQGCAALVLAGAVLLQQGAVANEPTLGFPPVMMEVYELSHDSGRYVMHYTAWLDAPVPDVYRTMTDFPRLHELHASIRESRVLDAAMDYADVQTRVRACFTIFCRQLERVERVVMVPNEELVATVDPARSDVRNGVSRWRFAPEDGGTRLTFYAEVEPKKAPPPVVGPALVRQNMARTHQELLEAVQQRLVGPSPAVLAGE